VETSQVALTSESSPCSVKAGRNGWLFPLGFILLAALSTLLVAYVPESLHALWLKFTISLTRGIGSISGIETASHADILSVNGFEMRIITQCTAIHYLLIISAAMLASYWHPLAYRLMGMMIAIPLLLVSNAVRLLITGLAGAVSPKLFNFVHEYLWVTLFILLTWGIWIAWERGIHLGSLKRRLPLLLLSCTLFHVLLTLLNNTVGTLVTGLANMMLAPFNHLVAVRFYWKGEKVLSVIGSETYTISLNGEILVLAVYSGIAVTGILMKEKIQIFRTAACWVLLFILCALVVAVNGMIIRVWGTEEAHLFLWLSPAIMTTVLMVSWRRTRLLQPDEGELLSRRL